jgi:predicted nuclease of restriction endonuclease-like (RecB) superfamily
LVTLYWEIGCLILQRQKAEGWGTKVIDRLSVDLTREFPDQKGFSARNLKYMRKFAESYSDKKIVQQAAAQIPWFHNCMILDKVQAPEQREWYIRATIEHGWSRAVLVHQIESEVYNRQGKAVTNFQTTLPAPQSDLAQQLVKDPYNFEFLGLGMDISEHQLEKALIERLKDFLVELGKGFAFVGQQYKLHVGDEDFYLDLLFYHLHLRSYVVIDLKVVPFKPEFAGKMNFYLSAVDEQFRHADDQPSIGLILCKERNRLVVEYALRDSSKPMGVATYRVVPRKLKGELPTAKQIEKGIGKA